MPVKPVMKVIVGRDAAGVRDAAARFGWEEHASSWEEVVRRDDIDVVDICTPGDTHLPIALAAAEAGKVILCEKPLANNVADAERMLDAVRSGGSIHMLCHNYRRAPAVALASSSAYRLIGAVTERLGLAGEFEVAYSAEEEEYGKPHPGVYLTTARRLGVAPTQCLAIEDSFNGVLAAKAARMRCVAIPEPAQRRDPRFGIADLVLDSLAGVDMGMWQRLND